MIKPDEDHATCSSSRGWFGYNIENLAEFNCKICGINACPFKIYIKFSLFLKGLFTKQIKILHQAGYYCYMYYRQIAPPL